MAYSQIARCEKEINRVSKLLYNGHTDIHGLSLASHDWNQEKKLLIQSLFDDRERISLYRDYLTRKTKLSLESGDNPALNHNSNLLYGFQLDITKWALRRGRAAIFADCGLGKTPMQLFWSDAVSRHTRKPVLILVPIAVADQTESEAIKFGIRAQIVDSPDDILFQSPGIYISNYEKLHWYEGKQNEFGGLVLDESSILKSMDGSLRQSIIDFSESIPYRLACTATPAPNDLVELCNHADFLGIMKPKEVKALFFKQTQDIKGQAHTWRLKHHATEDFYSWLASWSVALRSPSDLKYDNAGYNIPPLRFIEHKSTDTGVDIKGIQGRLRSRRLGIDSRVDATAEFVNADETTGPWVVWCNLNDESKLLSLRINGAVELTGSQPPKKKEQILRDFKRGLIRVLVTKPGIAGFGMNWQHCNKMAFVGLSDSYEQLYQAIRRCWRFGQDREVFAHIVTAENEQGIIDNIRRKEKQSAEIMDQLVKRTSVYTIENCKRSNMSYREDYTEGKWYSLLLGDSALMLDDSTVEPNSVGLSVFSPPFPSMYVYTNSPADVGNTQTVEELIDHFRFISAPLLKATMPGRSCCIHLTQAVAFKGVDGYIGIKDFRGKLILMMEEVGWIYYGEVTIDKNPQVKAIRTHDSGLLFKSLATDSAQMHMALADYIVQFRKPGENTSPIRAGISEKYGTQKDGWITSEEWIEWAAPVWYRHPQEYIRDGAWKKRITKLASKLDGETLKELQSVMSGKPDLLFGGIKETDTLQVRMARDGQDERHLCPLQLSVIERCIKLWSNPGDLVLDPFSGVASTGYVALGLKRRYLGVELKESYYQVACKNMASRELELKL